MLGVDGGADERDAHLVGGAFAPAHVLRRLARVAPVALGVVVAETSLIETYIFNSSKCVAFFPPS